MKDFQVPQRTVHVQVRLDGGAELEGQLFAPSAGPDGAPGRLGDRLNDPDENFLALRHGPDTSLVRKAAIVTIRLSGEDVDLEAHEGETACAVPVRLWLEGDRTVEGIVAYSMPPEKARILDFLNAAPPFIAVHGDGELLLVNRDRVLRARNLDGGRD